MCLIVCWTLLDNIQLIFKGNIFNVIIGFIWIDDYVGLSLRVSMLYVLLTR